MIRTQIDQWLAAASLPSNLPRTLDADGFWHASTADATLTLAISEKEGMLYVCLPLIQLNEGTIPEFMRELLMMQARMELPAGTMFGLDEEDETIALVGRVPVAHLDASIFEVFVQRLLNAAVTMPGKLRELVKAIEDDERMSATERTSYVETNEAASMFENTSADNLTDEQYMLQQMFQSIRV